MSQEKKGSKISPVAIILLIVGMVVGGIGGYAATAGQIGTFQNRIQGLETQVTGLQADKAQLQGQVSSLQDDKVRLQNTLTSLENDKASLQAQITTLQNDNLGLESQIDELKKASVDVSSYQSQINSLTTERDSLQQRVIQLNAKIEELNASLASRSDLAILATLFSPKGGAASQVIYWLGRANKSVHVLIYSFTLDGIGDAVLGAYQKGIDVKVVFEKSQVSKYSEYFRLAGAGVQVRNDTNPGLMHHKVAIIDGYMILVGSFNWSDAAEEDNNENLLVIRSKELASTFEQEFQEIWSFGR
jgi:cell division protein FtsB